MVRSIKRKSKRHRKLCRKTHVFLNGVEVLRCTYANDRTGVIHRFKTTSEGQIIIHNHELVREIVHGKVKILTTK